MSCKLRQSLCNNLDLNIRYSFTHLRHGIEGIKGTFYLFTLIAAVLLAASGIKGDILPFDSNRRRAFGRNSKGVRKNCAAWIIHPDTLDSHAGCDPATLAIGDEDVTGRTGNVETTIQHESSSIRYGALEKTHKLKGILPVLGDSLHSFCPYLFIYSILQISP